jgi:phosphatidylglycerophosphate synthase
MAFLNQPTPQPQRWLPPLGRGSPHAQFAVLSLVGLAMLGLIDLLAYPGAQPHGTLIAAVVYIAAAASAGLYIQRSYPHQGLGLCNSITLLRLVLVASLVIPLFSSGGEAWAVLAIAVVALALDGVDGWLARRERLVSAFGARFDVEVDSALGLILAVHAFVAGHAGALVIFLGLPRYLFVLAATFLPWLNRPLPDLFSRKVVCVLQIAVLIALQVQFVAESASAPLVALAAGALIWSFGRDIVWLWRARA